MKVALEPDMLQSVGSVIDCESAYLKLFLAMDACKTQVSTSVCAKTVVTL